MNVNQLNSTLNFVLLIGHPHTSDDGLKDVLYSDGIKLNYVNWFE